MSLPFPVSDHTSHKLWGGRFAVPTAAALDAWQIDPCRDAMLLQIGPRPDFCNGTYPDHTPFCPNGAHETFNAYYHDNYSTETGAGEIAGLAQDQNDPRFFNSLNNRYVHNHYSLPNINGTYFDWNCLNEFSGTCTLDTAAQWIELGQDVTGTFSEQP